MESVISWEITCYYVVHVFYHDMMIKIFTVQGFIKLIFDLIMIFTDIILDFHIETEKRK